MTNGPSQGGHLTRFIWRRPSTWVNSRSPSVEGGAGKRPCAPGGCGPDFRGGLVLLTPLSVPGMDRGAERGAGAFPHPAAGLAPRASETRRASSCGPWCPPAIRAEDPARAADPRKPSWRAPGRLSRGPFTGQERTGASLTALHGLRAHLSTPRGGRSCNPGPHPRGACGPVETPPPPDPSAVWPLLPGTRLPLQGRREGLGSCPPWPWAHTGKGRGAGAPR